MDKLKTRDSGIELLKIFAMIIIVISHVVQTLRYQEINGNLAFDLTMAGQGLTHDIIAALQYNGTIGNFMFFACSAWFLIDSHKVNKRKILIMIMDVWVISVAILVITYVIKGGNISSLEIIKNLLPTTYKNNWYITCYILFYAIHPILNQVIGVMNQQQHIRFVFAIVFIYYFWGFLLSIFGSADFFGNSLILWIVFYFVIAYMKKYMITLNNGLKMNVLLLTVGIIGTYGLIFGTNALKLVSGFFSDKMQYWNKGNNPFIILMSIALLNIARQIKWKNTAVNYVSSLTLFIYVIHENWFVRGRLRPYMWDQIYNRFGYAHVIMWIIIMTLVIFVVSVIFAAIYKSTIHKLVMKISDKIYNILRLIYGGMEIQLLKLK